jgi:UDP-N-acetylmuramate dehydrogenase
MRPHRNQDENRVKVTAAVDIPPGFILNVDMQTLSGTLVQDLTAAAHGKIKANEPLAAYTSYRIGGPTPVMVFPDSESEISRILNIVHTAELPLLVIGRGSNLLISDHGWEGVTLYLGDNLSGWWFEEDRAYAMAGTALLDFVRTCAAQGLAGLEKLAGIPGTVGGALKMNAGAFGQEIGTVTDTVYGCYPDGSPFTARGPEIGFGYRQAPGLDGIILTRSAFKLLVADRKTLEKELETTLARRAAKQPLSCPSCGSVFKRPQGHYAGALIENAGLKGKKIGGAMVSPKHAGFIVNTGNATAADIFALVQLVEETIKEKFGVVLEREVKVIGRF